MEESSCGIPPEALKKQELNDSKLISTTCVKCTKGRSLLVYRKESTCGNCFETALAKKFKQFLNVGRKNKGASEHILLAFSGGPCSRAMLHIFNTCLTERQSKATFFQASIIHIDESTVIGLTEDERKKKNDMVTNIAASYGFPLTIAPLEEIFNSGNWKAIQPDIEVDEKLNESEKLKKLFESSTTNTTREDLLSILRTHLLVRVAGKQGFDKVLLGSSGTRLGINLISHTCKGRGFPLSEEIAVLDSRYQGVNLLRPMRDFLSKEIAIYNRFKNIEPDFYPSLDTKVTSKFSIDHLTEEFIEGLQSEFPHTVHTLLRSSAKLSMPPDAASHFICSLCSSPLSPADISLVNEERARIVSCNNNAKNASCCNNTSGCCNSAEYKDADNTISLNNLVCYGCRRILQESDSELYPSYVREQTRELVVSTKLRDQIKEFLLDETET